MVSPHYQGKHAVRGGGEAEGGGKVVSFAPPLVFMGIRRWAEGLSPREPSLLIRLFAGTAAHGMRIVTTGEQNLPIFNEINGWRGAVPGATPFLPANVGERPSIRLFASFFGFGVDFAPEAASPSLTTAVPQSAEKPLKQGVAQRWPGLRHPPPRRHHFGCAHFGPCKMPRLSGPEQGDRKSVV